MARYLINTRNNRVFRLTPHLARRPYMVELTPEQGERWEQEMERAAKEGRDPQPPIMDSDDLSDLREKNPDKQPDLPTRAKSEEEDGVKPPAEDLDPQVDVSTLGKPALLKIAAKSGLTVSQSTRVTALRHTLQMRLAEICHKQGKTPAVDPLGGGRAEPNPETGKVGDGGEGSGGGSGGGDDQPKPVGQKTYYKDANGNYGVAEKGEYLPEGAEKVSKADYESATSPS